MSLHFGKKIMMMERVKEEDEDEDRKRIKGNKKETKMQKEKI